MVVGAVILVAVHVADALDAVLLMHSRVDL